MTIIMAIVNVDRLGWVDLGLRRGGNGGDGSNGCSEWVSPPSSITLPPPDPSNSQSPSYRPAQT